MVLPKYLSEVLKPELAPYPTGIASACLYFVVQLQQSGNYDKDSHTVAAAAALPIKSTLQGSNAVEAQPMAA